MAGELTTALENLESIRKRLSDTKDTLYHAEIERQQCLEDIEQSVDSETALSKDLEKQKKEKFDLEKQLAETQQEKTRFEAEKSGLEKRVADLEKQVEKEKQELTTRLNKLEMERIDLHKQLAETQQEKMRAEAEKSGLEKRVTDLEKQVEKEKQERTTRHHNLETEKVNLRKQLAETQQEKMKVEAEKSGLEKRVADLKKQVEKEKQELTTRLDKLVTEEIDLHKQLSEMQQEKKRVEVVKSELVTHVSALEKEKSELDTRVKAVEKDKLDLEEKLAGLQQTKDQVQTEKGGLETVSATRDEKANPQIPLSQQSRKESLSAHPIVTPEPPVSEPKNPPAQQKAPPAEQLEASPTPPAEKKTTAVGQNTPPTGQNNPAVQQKNPPTEQKALSAERNTVPAQQKTSPVEQRSPPVEQNPPTEQAPPPHAIIKTIPVQSRAVQTEPVSINEMKEQVHLNDQLRKQSEEISHLKWRLQVIGGETAAKLQRFFDGYKTQLIDLKISVDRKREAKQSATTEAYNNEKSKLEKKMAELRESKLNLYTTWEKENSAEFQKYLQKYVGLSKLSDEVVARYQTEYQKTKESNNLAAGYWADHNALSGGQARSEADMVSLNKKLQEDIDAITSTSFEAVKSHEIGTLINESEAKFVDLLLTLPVQGHVDG